MPDRDQGRCIRALIVGGSLRSRPGLRATRRGKIESAELRGARSAPEDPAVESQQARPCCRCGQAILKRSGLRYTSPRAGKAKAGEKDSEIVLPYIQFISFLPFPLSFLPSLPFLSPSSSPLRLSVRQATRRQSRHLPAIRPACAPPVTVASHPLLFFAALKSR